MGVLWDKVWRDLWENKGRTLQVVLIIAVGTFAIGMIIGTRQFMITGMQQTWQQSAPASIYLWNAPGIDDDALANLEHIDGVTAAQGYLQQSIEWRLSPDEPWKPAGLNARDDYQRQTLATLSLVSGQWPEKKTFAVGQGAEELFGLLPGTTLSIRVNDREAEIAVGGVVYDMNVQPPSFGGNIQFYTSREEFGHLTGDERFNRLLFAVDDYSETRANAIADAIQEKLEKQDVESGGMSPRGGRIGDPDKHFFQDALDALFFIMGFLALVALILGLFLVYNTISALINRQINQIGVLKAIGAKSSTIFQVYLTIVFAYGILALIVAIPLSALAARTLGEYLMAAFDAEGEFQLSTLALVAQVIIALGAPLVACTIPVWNGSRITVREAISTYGLNTSASLLDRVLGRLRGVPEMLALTISSTFRHKQRVILTQITLVLSGVIFMTVMTTRDAANYTYNDLLFSILRFDVNFITERWERTERVEALAQSAPGVEKVELWTLDNAPIRKAGTAESKSDHTAVLFGVPLPTELYGPQMRAGRWLTPADDHVIVLNNKIAEDVGVTVGDWVTLKLGINNEADWQVVGLLFDPIIGASASVPRDVLSRELRRVDRANSIWIQTADHSREGQLAVAESLRSLYTDNRVRLQAQSTFGKDTAAEIFDGINAQFAVVITLLATMSVLIGVVGSLALSGVLSLNVLERRREIGVLRAIGATSPAIFGLFIGEGLILGWLSWLIALPLSIPVGQFMVQGLSNALGAQMVFEYTPTGALLWLGIITVLSALASFLPARAATKISVRESLAYE